MSKNTIAAATVTPDGANSDTKPLPHDAAVDELAALQREDVLTLELSDLVSDSNGEIVLFNDSHLPALAVRADTPPVESGAVGSYVTAAGDDVSGYRFVAFDNGTKLFYQDSTDLVILGAHDGPHS